MPEIISSTKGIPNMVVHPDMRLYQPCETVEKIDDQVKSDIALMIKAIEHYDGVGLGACQIGIMKRIAICCISYFMERFPDSDISDESLKNEKYLVIINPEVVSAENELMTNKEGCLSLPGVYTEITRPKKVSVKFTDINGKEKVITVQGYLAANFQHEIDHTNGITLLSKLSPMKKNIQQKKLEKVLRTVKIKY